MRAAILRAIGETPSVEAMPNIGTPQGDEIVVRMLRAPINPADRLLIAGAYSVTPQLPMVLGAEGVGIVLAVGDASRRIRIGDHVLPLSRGNWTTHRVLREVDVVRIASDFPIDHAAMLRINPATAWRLLEAASLNSGDWIIQNAAASSVAALVRAFARARGVNVINVVRKLGVSPQNGIVLEDGADLAVRAEAASQGASITLALDCVAGPSSGRLASCLAQDGQLIVFGHLSGQPSSISSTLLTSKQLVVRGFSLRPAEARATPDDLQAFYEALATTLRAEQSWAPAVRTFPLSSLDAALHASEQGGRVLLALDD